MAALTTKIGEIDDRAAQQTRTYVNTTADKTAGVALTNLGNVAANTSTLVGETNALNAFNEAKSLREDSVVGSMTDPDFKQNVISEYGKQGKVIPPNTSKGQLLALKQISDERKLRENNPSRRATAIIDKVYGDPAGTLQTANAKAEIASIKKRDDLYDATVLQITPVLTSSGAIDKDATIQKGAQFNNIGLTTDSINAKGSKAPFASGERVRSSMFNILKEGKEYMDSVVLQEIEKSYNDLRTVDPANQEASKLAFENFSNSISNIESNVRGKYTSLNETEIDLLTAGVKENAKEWMDLLKIEDISSAAGLARASKSLKDFNQVSSQLFKKGLFSNANARQMMYLTQVLGGPGAAAFLSSSDTSITEIMNEAKAYAENFDAPPGTTNWGFEKATKDITGKDPLDLSKTNTPEHAVQATAILRGVQASNNNVNFTGSTNADNLNSPNSEGDNQKKKAELYGRAVSILLPNDAVTSNWDNTQKLVNELTNKGSIDNLKTLSIVDPEAAGFISSELAKSTNITITKDMKDLADLVVDDSNSIDVISDNGTLKVIEKPQSKSELPMSDSDKEYQKAMSLGMEAATGTNLLTEGRSTVKLTSSGRKALKLTETINNLTNGAIRLSDYLGVTESPTQIRKVFVNTFDQIRQTTSDNKTESRPLFGRFGAEGPKAWEDNGPWVQIGEVNWSALLPTPMESFKLRIPGRDSSTVEKATPPLSNATPPVTEPTPAPVTESEPAPVTESFTINPNTQNHLKYQTERLNRRFKKQGFKITEEDIIEKLMPMVRATKYFESKDENTINPDTGAAGPYQTIPKEARRALQSLSNSGIELSDDMKLLASFKDKDLVSPEKGRTAGKNWKQASEIIRDMSEDDQELLALNRYFEGTNSDPVLKEFLEAPTDSVYAKFKFFNDGYLKVYHTEPDQINFARKLEGAALFMFNVRVPDLSEIQKGMLTSLFSSIGEEEELKVAMK